MQRTGLRLLIVCGYVNCDIIIIPSRLPRLRRARRPSLLSRTRLSLPQRQCHHVMIMHFSCVLAVCVLTNTFRTWTCMSRAGERLRQSLYHPHPTQPYPPAPLPRGRTSLTVRVLPRPWEHMCMPPVWRVNPHRTLPHPFTPRLGRAGSPHRGGACGDARDGLHRRGCTFRIRAALLLHLG